MEISELISGTHTHINDSSPATWSALEGPIALEGLAHRSPDQHSGEPSKFAG